MRTALLEKKAPFQQREIIFQNRGRTQTPWSKKSQIGEVGPLIREYDQNSRSCVYISAPHFSSHNDDSDMTVKIGFGLPKNYRSAFFENGNNLEDYHLKLREALKVQCQKEENISFDQV